MPFIEHAQDKIEETLNAEGRHPSHVALGLLICLGAVGATAAIAAARPQPLAPGAPPQARRSLGRALWPAIFSVTTLAAIRVWNAPDTPQRTRALTAWGALQGLNAFWMLVSPRHRATQIAASVTTALMTLVYARTASEVDEKAATFVGPAGWASLAGLFAKKQPVATVH